MSSSQSIPVPQPQPTDSDSVMVEAPDSPPTTTTNNSTMFALPLPSFSGSQTAPHAQANSGATRTSLNGGESSNASASSGGKHNFGLPGSSYQNKKFHEDWVRASENLTDKEWDATQYGDPLMVHNGVVVPK
ncbi:hypothetical protein HYALB_00012742 [Hymenoscyphus albidus]|uniref:Uncharacterized protein n=1 Tax=Hymenoscyphus albidus TaxID=595503 RepID=A0A9N9LUG4_9HELO|nr:hypothetical protein HYALB_00012742 [Hymenoscyphus albidus]